MNICIASICFPDYARLGDVTHPVWEAYCEKQGYAWHVERAPLSDRGANWDKIILISRLLPRYDFVLWVGCDTLVTNSELTIQQQYQPYDGLSILLAADLFGLNSDVMLFRQSVWSELFLHAVHNVGYIMYRNHHWAEQEAIIRFAHQAPYQEHVGIVPQKGFNSYLQEVYGRPAHWPGNWSPGDWILHFPGLSLERRIELAQDYAKLAV